MAFAEGALDADMDHHLGQVEQGASSRNGYRRKMLTTGGGRIEFQHAVPNKARMSNFHAIGSGLNPCRFLAGYGLTFLRHILNSYIPARGHKFPFTRPRFDNLPATPRNIMTRDILKEFIMFRRILDRSFLRIFPY